MQGYNDGGIAIEGGFDEWFFEDYSDECSQKETVNA